MMKSSCGISKRIGLKNVVVKNKSSSNATKNSGSLVAKARPREHPDQMMPPIQIRPATQPLRAMQQDQIQQKIRATQIIRKTTRNPTTSKTYCSRYRRR